MTVSSVIREFDEIEEISPAQRRIYLAGIVKEMATSGIRNARTFAVTMQMLSEDKIFPGLEIQGNQPVKGHFVENATAVKLEGNLNQPSLSVLVSLLSALGNIKGGENPLEKGSAVLNDYFTELAKEEVQVTVNELAEPAFLYLRTNHPKFIDHLPDLETFKLAWASPLGSDPSTLDGALNAAFINVLFGTQTAHDIFKIYVAITHTPIEGEYLNPGTADFMSAYLLSVCAGV